MWLGLCAAMACELEGTGGTPNGPGPGTGSEQTLTLPSTATLDGWVRSDLNLATSGSQPITGDIDASAPGLGYRQFYSFDLSGLPPGVTVTSATLRLYQGSTLGTPYVDLGDVVVDHVDYGATLLGAAYDAPAIVSNIGALSQDGTIEYKTMTVTDRVQADVAAGRTRSQFRLRFSVFDNNNDAGNDFAQFLDADFGGANPPQLVVTYIP
jgi:hypothetical protein